MNDSQNISELSYANLGRQFKQAMEHEPFFADAIAEVLRIDDFDEYRQIRERTLVAHRLHAERLTEVLKAADEAHEPKERLRLIAPFYRITAELQRDRMALDRSLSVPGNISDKYIEQLKSYIAIAVNEKMRQGLVRPSDVKNKAGELLVDLIAPVGFLTLESAKLVDYLETFEKIKESGKDPLDSSAFRDNGVRALITGLTKYNNGSVKSTFEDFPNYAAFIGKEDRTIRELADRKAEMKERRTCAEEYVLSGLDGRGSIGFSTSLRAVNELERYRVLEDPAECRLGSAQVFNRFWGILATTLGEILSKPVSLADVLKVDEVETYLKLA